MINRIICMCFCYLICIKSNIYHNIFFLILLIYTFILVTQFYKFITIMKKLLFIAIVGIAGFASAKVNLEKVNDTLWIL